MNQTTDISFVSFYVTEFFNRVVDESKNKLPEHQTALLDRLRNFFRDEQRIFSGLETLAQFNGTNELSIFLFDMTEGLNNFEPDQLYQLIPDRVEDFVNLFGLLMEEPENLSDLEKAVQQLEEKYGAPEGVGEEVSPLAGKELSFADFYHQEALQQLDDRLSKTADIETKTNMLAVLNVLREFSGNADQAEPKVADLISKTRQVFPADLESQNPDELVNTLPEKIDSLVTDLEDLARQNKALFDQILTSRSVPSAKEEKKKEEKPLTVDELLKEYFRSELDDHLAVIKPKIRALSDKYQAGLWNDLTRQLRSLKEISMIHGYTGVEWVSDRLIAGFDRAKKEKLRLTAESLSLFEDLYRELENVDQFTPTNKNEKFVNKFEALISEIEATFVPAGGAKETPEATEPVGKEPETPAPATEEQATEPVVAEQEAQAEEPPAETVADIAFGDTDALKNILGDVLNRLFSLHRKIQRNYSEDELNNLQKLMAAVKDIALLFYPAVAGDFIEPVLQVYDQLTEVEAGRRNEVLNVLTTVWENVLQQIPQAETFPELKSSFQQAAELLQEKVFGLDDEAQMAVVFADAYRQLWKPVEPVLAQAFTAPGSEAEAQYREYFTRFMDNAGLLGFQSLTEVGRFFHELADRPDKETFGEEIVQEIQNSWQLVLDRIEATGKAGDYNDILDALAEVLPVISEEEDVEQIFIQESLEHLQNARAALDELEENPENREPLRQIDSEIHSIRSSAHLLEKESVVDFAVTLEEAAEMFEAPEVPMPANFFPVFRQALDTLQELIHDPEIDYGPASQNIEDLLNAIILEQEEAIAEAPGEEEVSEGEEQEKEVETEAPLFAESEEIDEDLLEIFKEEAEKFVLTLAESNQKLKENLDSQQALSDLEQAAHSLRSSAKMMGFREIAQLTAGLEEIVEAINNEEIENTADLQDRISEAIELIRRLSEGEEIPKREVARVMNLLDISRKKVKTTAADEEKAKDVLKKTRELFLEEAAELIAGLNQDMLELEKMPESDLQLNNIQRKLHTLKGSAYMAKFEHIGDLAHKLEDYFEVFRNQRSQVKEEMLNPAFTALDLIEELVQAAQKDVDALPAQFTSRLAELDNKLYYYQSAEAPRPEETPAETPVVVETKKTKKKTDENVVKINTDHLDKMVNIATDLVVNRTELSAHFDHLKQLLQKIANEKKELHQTRNYLEEILEQSAKPQAETSAPPSLEEENNLEEVVNVFKTISHTIDSVSSEMERLSRDFEKNIQQIAVLSRMLHSDILRVRMVPVEVLFNRFPRAIRDMAKAQGKKVTLTVEGNNTEMDRAMIEALTDPIMHILRNAVDHGIETPQERKALGKKVTGSIILRARQDKNQVVIDISDDGRGIDLDKVKKVVVKKKLATKKALATMTEAEILNFIFYPDFSTKDKTDKVSGRGIGLDVVSNQIQKLRGNIRIRTEKNQGTTFSLRVPLTLVISQALLTEMHGNVIAIPMIAVQESLELDRHSILVDDVRKYIQARGKLLPFVRIEDVLKFGESAGELPEKLTVLILHDAGVSVALGVNRIIGRQEIVIKSLGGPMQNVEYISGGTILADGSVALILDYVSVIRDVEFQFFGNVRNPHSIREVRGEGRQPRMELHYQKAPMRMKTGIKKKTIKGRKPRILVVDDSVSLRNFVSSVLENQGYATLQASDGPEALKIVQDEIVDLIITDLEMPKMHGFDLIAKIREQEQWNDLPIVILTGRSAKAQSDKGMELGANAFIGKPFKEGDLLQAISMFFK